MRNNSRQKYRVKGNNEFAFVTNTYLVKKTSKQKVEKLAVNRYLAEFNNSAFSGEIIQKKQNCYSVMVNRNIYHFLIEKEDSLNRRNGKVETVINEQCIQLKAPMPGKICEIFASKGDVVNEGDPLLILEAMKMRNQLLAPRNAIISVVLVRKNEPVLGDQVLMEMNLTGS